MTLVTTIIPAFNAAAWINDAIDSALSQKVDQEILVINDGSTDNTNEIVAAYQSPVRLISKDNGGVSSARNLGLREAQGDLVAFLDADDLWHPSKLSKQIDILDRFPNAGTVICDERTIDRYGHIINASFFSTLPYYHELPHTPGILSKPITWLTRTSFIPTPGVLVRKALAESVGFFDETLHIVEDRDYWIRLGLKADIAIIPEALVDVRQLNHSSLSKATRDKWATALLTVITRHEENLRKAITKEGDIPDEILSNVFREIAQILWDSSNYTQAYKAFTRLPNKTAKEYIKQVISKLLVTFHYHEKTNSPHN